MRYETRLIKMLTGLGIASMAPDPSSQPRSPRWEYGAKQDEARMNKYRKKRKVRNKMARESRRRNRA